MGAQQGGRALFGPAQQVIPGGGSVGGAPNTSQAFRAEQQKENADQMPDRKRKIIPGMYSASTATGQGGGAGSFTPPPGQMPQSGPAGGMPSGPYGPMRGGLRMGTSAWGTNRGPR